MAKNVIINGVSYSDVPYVEIPLSGGSGKLAFAETLVQVMWIKGLVTLKERDAMWEKLQEQMGLAGS